MRRTKIICTLGPQTESAETLEKMIAAGMGVARLNMSHATHEWTRAVVERIRSASAKAGQPCAILMDTQGPAIRTGDLPLPFHLKPGEVFEFTVKGARSDEDRRQRCPRPGARRDIVEQPPPPAPLRDGEGRACRFGRLPSISGSPLRLGEGLGVRVSSDRCCSWKATRRAAHRSC